MKVMSSQSVYLITRLLGLLSPLSSWSSICHPLVRKTTYSVCMVLLLLSLLLLFRCYSLVEELLDYSFVSNAAYTLNNLYKQSSLYNCIISIFDFPKEFVLPLYDNHLFTTASLKTLRVAIVVRSHFTPYTSNTQCLSSVQICQTLLQTSISECWSKHIKQFYLELTDLN